jgi:hypothetical protein
LLHQETNGNIHTTTNLKIYGKKRNLPATLTEVSQFDSSKLVALWFNSRGFCIIACEVAPCLCGDPVCHIECNMGD